jgi:hypothetical protein
MRERNDTIITIEGREAIPVRAIPFITGWLMSPDNIAASLANNDLGKKFKDLFAYHLPSNGRPARLLPRDWDAIDADLEILFRPRETNGKVSQQKQAVWRQESIKLLPPGTFVWKDGFEQAFTLFYSSDNHTGLEERSGERELNFFPLIPLESRGLVTEGFPVPLEIDMPEKIGAVDQDYLSERLVRMNQAAKKFWANASRNERDTHPDNAKVATWFEKNGFSSTLANKAATLIRPEWAPAGRKPEE